MLVSSLLLLLISYYNISAEIEIFAHSSNTKLDTINTTIETNNTEISGKIYNIKTDTVQIVTNTTPASAG